MSRNIFWLAVGGRQASGGRAAGGWGSVVYIAQQQHSVESYNLLRAPIVEHVFWFFIFSVLVCLFFACLMCMLHVLCVECHLLAAAWLVARFARGGSPLRGSSWVLPFDLWSSDAL